MPSYILITIKNKADNDTIWRAVSNVEAVVVANDAPRGSEWDIEAKLFASRARVLKANSEIRKIPGVVSTAVAFRRKVRQKRE